MMKRFYPVIAVMLIVAVGFLLISAGESKKEPRAEKQAAATKKGEEVMASNAEAKQTDNVKTDTATFAAGCFWGVEATFRKIDGVVSTSVGYTGGKTENPTYKQVCTDRTGHAEAVEVVYDPKKVTYDDLLKVFWNEHDPTQMNRQGPDYGSQYRSVIFYHSPEQRKTAERSRQTLAESKKYDRPIVTEIIPASTFYRAEEYHQQYLEKRGLESCRTY